jgi:hypothetical protein
MHFDHLKKKFVCIECEKLEKLMESPEVVETDRRQLLRSCHILTELLTKERDTLNKLLSQIGEYVEDRINKAEEFFDVASRAYDKVKSVLVTDPKLDREVFVSEAFLKRKQNEKAGKVDNIEYLDKKHNELNTILKEA